MNKVSGTVEIVYRIQIGRVKCKPGEETHTLYREAIRNANKGYEVSKRIVRIQVEKKK